MTTTAKKSFAINNLIKKMITINGDNEFIQAFKSILEEMSLKDFVKYVDDIRDGKEYLPYELKAYDGKKKPDVYYLIDLGKKYGVEFMQKILYTNPSTGDVEVSEVERMVGLLPCRRQQQHIHTKIAISNTRGKRDSLTGQVAGDSKMSSFSRVEQFMVESLNLTEVLNEQVRVHGGNPELAQAVFRQVSSSGNTDFTLVDDGKTRAKASDSVNAFFRAMNLDNTI